MFKILISGLIGVASGLAFASSNDFGNFTKAKTLTLNDLYDRLSIRGELFETSADGNMLLTQGNEFRLWHFANVGETILSNWNTESEGIKLSLRHEWSLSKTGVLSVHIEQFESMRGQMPYSPKVIYGKKLRDETVVIKDFQPITWVVSTDATHRVVARFTPQLDVLSEFIEPTALPLFFDNAAITDSKNRVWATGLDNLSGKYVSIKTYLGTVYMSFYQFPGSKEIGSAQGNYINLHDDGIFVGIRNARDFVAGKARVKIYGLVDTKKKSEGRGSIYSSSGSKEQEFVDSLKK